MTQLDFKVICKLARQIALKYLDLQFYPLSLKTKEVVVAGQDRIINQKESSKIIKTFKQVQSEKIKESQQRLKIEEFAIESALETYCQDHFKAAFLLTPRENSVDPEEFFTN